MSAFEVGDTLVIAVGVVVPARSFARDFRKTVAPVDHRIFEAIRRLGDERTVVALKGSNVVFRAYEIDVAARQRVESILAANAEERRGHLPVAVDLAVRNEFEHVAGHGHRAAEDGAVLVGLRVRIRSSRLAVRRHPRGVVEHVEVAVGRDVAVELKAVRH